MPIANPQPRRLISPKLLAEAEAERDRRHEYRDLNEAELARLRRRAPELEHLNALIGMLDVEEGMLLYMLHERRAEVIRDLARANAHATHDAGNIGELIAGAALRAVGSAAQIVRARTGDGRMETLWRVLIEWGCSAEQIGALAELDGERNHDGAARKRAQRWIKALREELVKVRRGLPHDPYASVVDDMIARLGSGTSDA